MTAEEMKATESGAQSAPLPLEGVDISPKQDEGVLKVRRAAAGTGGRLPEPAAVASPSRGWAALFWGVIVAGHTGRQKGEDRSARVLASAGS